MKVDHYRNEISSLPAELILKLLSSLSLSDVWRNVRLVNRSFRTLSEQSFRLRLQQSQATCDDYFLHVYCFRRTCGHCFGTICSSWTRSFALKYDDVVEGRLHYALKESMYARLQVCTRALSQNDAEVYVQFHDENHPSCITREFQLPLQKSESGFYKVETNAFSVCIFISTPSNRHDVNVSSDDNRSALKSNHTGIISTLDDEVVLDVSHKYETSTSTISGNPIAGNSVGLVHFEWVRVNPAMRIHGMNIL